MGVAYGSRKVLGRKIIMVRKKQEFDPLADPIGDGLLQKKKSKEKSFDVLGWEFCGEYLVEKESLGSCADTSFRNSSDLLMEAGCGSSSKLKPLKKGFFSSMFERNERKKQQMSQKESMPLREEEGRSETHTSKHVRDLGLGIQDCVMEIDTVDRILDPASECNEPECREWYEKSVLCRHYAREPRGGLFENEKIGPSSANFVSIHLATQSSPSFVESTSQGMFPTIIGQDMHACHLCGTASPFELPLFGLNSGNYMPLCRICYREVKTLIKFLDPKDELTIKAEWRTLCPNLDSDRVAAIIAEARTTPNFLRS
jgi:hypothetical protein